MSRNASVATRNAAARHTYRGTMMATGDLVESQSIGETLPEIEQRHQYLVKMGFIEKAWVSLLLELSDPNITDDRRKKVEKAIMDMRLGRFGTCIDCERQLIARREELKKAGKSQAQIDELETLEPYHFVAVYRLVSDAAANRCERHQLKRDTFHFVEGIPMRRVAYA